MLRIAGLFWTDGDVDHLWVAHQVTPAEIDEVILGIDGEPPSYRARRAGDFYVVYGETGGGRLLYIVLEPLSDRQFRPFAARDMEPKEIRAYRKGK